jgi:DNA repair protein RecN (Recombination protein N)
MLQRLFVQNFALIDNLEIHFQEGLTVITGETGAGKSILLGAIALAMGARADRDSLKNKEKKCIVEIEYDVQKLTLQEFFDTNELDFDLQTIIRREISPSGKSRAFINDTPVNLSLVKELGNRLIDIHSQHENLELNQFDFQFSVIDILADNFSSLKEYQNNYNKYQHLLKNINNLKEKHEIQKQRHDFIDFQYNELENAKLKSNEQNELEQEQNRLENSETIAENLSQALVRFNREDYGILDELNNAKQEISRIASYFHNGEDLQTRINSSLIDLTDLVQDLTEKADTIQYDPQRLDEINKRLNLIYSLQQKHNKPSIDDLLFIKNELEDELNAFESFEEDLQLLEKKKIELFQQLSTLADKLHKSRLEAAEKTSDNINEQLKELGMASAIFSIEVQKSDELSKYGKSSVSFKFAPDKKTDSRLLTKVASGGELSRIMLILKSLIAAKKSLPTIIFDEIDTGVSGEIANKMGQIMKSMSGNMQLIAITHLPQIAAKGEHHKIVYKTQEDTGSKTKIKNITEAERIIAIAQMLSTDNPSDAAIANAKELLSN